MPERWLEKQLLPGADDRRGAVFARSSTFNWMRSLAIETEACGFDDQALDDFYMHVERRAPIRPEFDVRSFERLLMARHHNAAIAALRDSNADPHSISRLAIMAWYYVIYEAASAMTIATSGNPQSTAGQTHAGTSKLFHSDVALRGLAAGPFGFHTRSLVQTEIDSGVDSFRTARPYSLKQEATTREQANGQLCEYLNGTADREAKKARASIKAKNPKFKALGVENFRTDAAKKVRDEALARKSVNFLSQAYRYRGKANYRDSLYLSYGRRDDERLTGLVQDLGLVSDAFLKMASAYISRRVEERAWARFGSDMRANGII